MPIRFFVGVMVPTGGSVDGSSGGGGGWRGGGGGLCTTGFIGAVFDSTAEFLEILTEAFGGGAGGGEGDGGGGEGDEGKCFEFHGAEDLSDGIRCCKWKSGS